MEKILVIGGVAAGATAAAKLRRLSGDVEITVLEAGPDISFANCGLPYYIGRDIENRSSLILQSPVSFKEQYNVNVFTNTKAIKIDREQKLVYTENTKTNEKKTFEYSKLILAQGGLPLTPPIEGASLPHVFTLWTLANMDAIDAFIKEQKPKKATIVGGGFIGLEMAEALAKRGLKVSVVEKMPHVMNVVDPEFAGFIEEELLSYGLEVYKNVGVQVIGKDQVLLDNGSAIESDMVLLSIGVRPTLDLAKDAGLEIGSTGGLQVDADLRTSDPSIFAAGDMIEIEHRVHQAKVRIPLAGPANKQGRIAAENALGGNHLYPGSLGTSIVRVFEAVVGITGLSLKAAKAAGIDAAAVTVHKEHHTAYYPGAQEVTVRLIYDKTTGCVIGGETAGYAGADRRLDVIATAVFGRMTIHDLANIDFAYSPPLGTANDAINMAAFSAENRNSGYAPSLTPEELEEWIKKENPLILDVRDPFAYNAGHVENAHYLPPEILELEMAKIPKGHSVLVYDENGKKGHQMLRKIQGLCPCNVVNVSGGYTSLQRHARAMGFSELKIPLAEVEQKSLENGLSKEGRSAKSSLQQTEHSANASLSQKEHSANASLHQTEHSAADTNTPIIVDVRTSREFARGAYPNAINIPLDELEERIDEFGPLTRKITVYCASGARSEYAKEILERKGFTNVINGGGIIQMMHRK